MDKPERQPHAAPAGGDEQATTTSGPSGRQGGAAEPALPDAAAVPNGAALAGEAVAPAPGAEALPPSPLPAPIDPAATLSGFARGGAAASRPTGSDPNLATLPPSAGAAGSRSRSMRPWSVAIAVAAGTGLVAVLVPLFLQGDDEPELVAAPSGPVETPWNVGYPSGPSTVDPAAITPSPSGSAVASVPATPSRSGAASAKPSPTRSATPRATGPKANTSGVNVARGKPAFASTEADGTRAAAAVDGDLSTRWSSAYSAPEWIMVDLGEAWQISTVTVAWETAYGRGYRVEVSGDGNTWKSIYSTTAGEGGTVKAPAPAGTTGRYVRLYGTQVATIWGFSLFELEVR